MAVKYATKHISLHVVDSVKKYIICEHVSFNLSGYFALTFTHSFMPVYILKVFIKIPFRM